MCAIIGIESREKKTNSDYYRHHSHPWDDEKVPVWRGALDRRVEDLYIIVATVDGIHVTLNGRE